MRDRWCVNDEVTYLMTELQNSVQSDREDYAQVLADLRTLLKLKESHQDQLLAMCRRSIVWAGAFLAACAALVIVHGVASGDYLHALVQCCLLVCASMYLHLAHLAARP